MTANLLFTYTGWILTAVGAGVAVLALYRDHKFRAQVEIDNWAELKTAIQVNAQCQVGLKRYIETSADKVDAEIVRRLSTSDAFAQELILGILKRVHYSNPKLSYQDIQRWKAEGKLGQAHADMLVRISRYPRLPSDVTIGFDSQVKQ